MPTHAAIVERIIETLTAERKRRGVSQESLAVLAGVSDSCIRHLEHGRSTPTIVTLLKISQALELDLPDVLRAASDGRMKKPPKS